MNLKLEIPSIILNIFIGYYEEEQIKKNPVEISILVEYKSLPLICLNDDLDFESDNIIRYDYIVQSLIEFCEDKKFCTVEKWCYELSQMLIKEHNFERILSRFVLKFTKKNILMSNAPQGINFVFEKNF